MNHLIKMITTGIEIKIVKWKELNMLILIRPSAKQKSNVTVENGCQKSVFIEKQLYMFLSKETVFLYLCFLLQNDTNKYISIKLYESELNSIQLSIEKCHFP